MTVSSNWTGARNGIVAAFIRLVENIVDSDSNTTYGGHGNTHGLEKALVSVVGCSIYATPVVSAGGSGGSSGNDGVDFASMVPSLGANGSYTGAPAAQAAYWNPVAGLTEDLNSQLNYVNVDGTIVAGTAWGCVLGTTWNVGFSDALIWQIDVGGNMSGGGTITPGCRMGLSPYTNFTFVGGNVAHDFAALHPTDVVMITRELSAANVASSATKGLEFKLTPNGGSATTADGFVGLQRVYRKNARVGASSGGLINKPGKGTRQAGLAMEEQSYQQFGCAIDHYIAPQVAAGQSPYVNFWFWSVDNDFNDTVMSRDGVNLSNTALGYAANLRHLLDLTDEYMQELAGVSRLSISGLVKATNYRVIIVPGKRVSDTTQSGVDTGGSHDYGARQAAYESYVAAAMGVVAEAPYSTWCHVLSVHNLFTAAQAQAAGWYVNNTTDRIHMTQTGYEAVWNLIMAEAIKPRQELRGRTGTGSTRSALRGRGRN